MTIPISSVAKAMTIILFFLMLSGVSSLALATQNDFALSGKEIIERLTRLEEGQRGLNKRIDDLRSELKGDI